MTTNSHNLTFGEWLARGNVSPDTFESYDQATQTRLHDAWEEGQTPRQARAAWIAARSNS